MYNVVRHHVHQNNLKLLADFSKLRFNSEPAQGAMIPELDEYSIYKS